MVKRGFGSLLGVVLVVGLASASGVTKTAHIPEDGPTASRPTSGATLQLSQTMVPRAYDEETPFAPRENGESAGPMFQGDGWILPTNVIADPAEDNWTPMVAVDGNGVLWCTENTFETGYYAAVGIYYSTDQGLSWNFRTYIAASVDLGDPVIAIDVQRSPNKMYLSFWADYSFILPDYDMGYFTLDISGTSLINGAGGWLETSIPDVAGPSIVMVERGYATNYAFIAWENNNGSTFQVRVARSINYGSSWTTSNIQSLSSQYIGQVWGNAGNNTNPCILVNYKQNTSGTDWSQATQAVLAYSTDRGASYTLRTRDFSPSYIFQTSSAIGFGTNYVVWAVQVNPNISDGNIFIRYSTDRCNTWGSEYYIENSPLGMDSRMPMVVVDGMQQYNFTSQNFYIGFYRETGAGSGDGNYFFKMCPVNAATAAASWVPPSNADSFAILDEASYDVKEANWAQLHLTSMIRNGGYTPALVWNHEVSTSDHNIHFTRAIDPVYIGVNEGKAENILVLRNPVSHGTLNFVVPPAMAGQSLVFYGSDGRVVHETALAAQVSLNLPSGVYFWKTGEVSGKVVLEK